MTDAEGQRRRRADAARRAGREPGKVGRPRSQPCGTVAAYKRHQRRGEQPCEACRQAERERQAKLYQRRKGK